MNRIQFTLIPDDDYVRGYWKRDNHRAFVRLPIEKHFYTDILKALSAYGSQASQYVGRDTCGNIVMAFRHKHEAMLFKLAHGGAA
jgi:hypothetical protein